MMHICTVATLCFPDKTIPRNYYYCVQDDNSLCLCFKNMYRILFVAIFTSTFIFSMFKSSHTYRNINISNLKWEGKTSFRLEVNKNPHFLSINKYMDETGMRKRNLCLLTCFLVPVTRQRKSQSLEGSAFACQWDKETFQDLATFLVRCAWRRQTQLTPGTMKNLNNNYQTSQQLRSYFFTLDDKWDLIKAILALIFLTKLTWIFLLEVWSPGSLHHYP